MKNKFIIVFFGFVFLMGCSEDPTTLTPKPLRKPVVGDTYVYHRHYLDDSLHSTRFETHSYSITDTGISYGGELDVFSLIDNKLVLHYYRFDENNDLLYLDSAKSTYPLVRYPIYTRKEFLYPSVDTIDINGVHTTFVGSIVYDGEDEMKINNKYFYSIKLKTVLKYGVSTTAYTKADTYEIIEWFVPELGFITRSYSTNILSYSDRTDQYKTVIDDSLVSYSIK